MRRTLVFVVLSIPFASFSQELQRTAFRFLGVPVNARVAALGGVNVSLANQDPNAFFYNPALVSDTLQNYASANYQFYVGNIGHAGFSYLPSFQKTGMMALGVQHFNYGTIKGYDASGNEIGDYTASETALLISKSHQIGAFRMGATLKPVFSSLVGYRASAILFDIGGVFVHPDKDFKVGMVIKNAGFLLKDYSETSDSRLPLDVQLGTSFKPAHMPFRFSFTVFRLVQPEIVNYRSNQVVDASVLDKVFRHFNFGAELLLHRNVNILLGYNYGLHRELRLDGAGGSAGLSLGFLLKVKTFDFTFSRSTYVVRSPSYTFTLSANLKKLLKKRSA